MSEVELHHRTSFEFVYFKEFAQFIVDNSKKKLDDTFFSKLIEILNLEVSPGKLMKPGTLANYFSRVQQHNEVFKLPKESYILFCKSFLATYKNLMPEIQDEYNEIKTVFDQWKSSLDSKYNLNEDVFIHKENNAKNENVPQRTDEIYIKEKEAIYISKNMHNKESSDDKQPVTHNQFYEILDLISTYYTWDRSCELQHEFILANMFAHFVRQRKVENYSIKHIRSLKDKYKENNFTYAEWEIYEIYGERIVCRSLQFSQLPDCDDASFPGFESYITLGRKEKPDTSKEDHALFNSAPPEYVHDRFEYDELHETIAVSNCGFERNESLKSYFKENYNFNYLQQNNYHYLHPNSEDIHAGHKCSLDHNGILTCIPAFLAANFQETSKQAPYYLEYNIDSTDIPTNIRSRLLAWRDLKLFPFKNIYLTAHLTLIGEIFYPPFSEGGLA